MFTSSVSEYIIHAYPKYHTVVEISVSFYFSVQNSKPPEIFFYVESKGIFLKLRESKGRSDILVTQHSTSRNGYFCNIE